MIVHHNHWWAKKDSREGGFAHKYVTRALQDHPGFFKGMAVIDPELGVDEGCETAPRGFHPRRR